VTYYAYPKEEMLNTEVEEDTLEEAPVRVGVVAYAVLPRDPRKARAFLEDLNRLFKGYVTPSTAIIDRVEARSFEPLLAIQKASVGRLIERGVVEQSRSPVDPGMVLLDLEAQTLFVGSRNIPLQPQQWKLVSHLLLVKDDVVPWEDLVKLLWPDTRDPRQSLQTLRVSMYRLRKSLVDTPFRLHTVTGVGLRITCRAPLEVRGAGGVTEAYDG